MSMELFDTQIGIFENTTKPVVRLLKSAYLRADSLKGQIVSNIASQKFQQHEDRRTSYDKTST